MTKEVKTDDGLQEILDEFVLFTDNTPYSNEATELSLFLRQCGYEDAMDRLGLELMEYLAVYHKKHELKARLEELESALYVYENQVPYRHALAGALGGAEKDLSEGIFVEFDGSKKVVTGGINFKLPHFFNDRIAELEKELEKYE